MHSLNAFDAFIYQAFLSSVEQDSETYVVQWTDEMSDLITEPLHTGKNTSAPSTSCYVEGKSVMKVVCHRKVLKIIELTSAAAAPCARICGDSSRQIMQLLRTYVRVGGRWLREQDIAWFAGKKHATATAASLDSRAIAH